MHIHVDQLKKKSKSLGNIGYTYGVKNMNMPILTSQK